MATDEIEVITSFFSHSQILEAVSQSYGFCVADYQQLPSYEDVNFLLRVSSVKGNSYIREAWPHGYIVKILNNKASEKPALRDGERAMMMHLRDRGFITPLHVLQKNGKHFCFLTQDLNSGFLVTTPTDSSLDYSVNTRFYLYCYNCIPGQTIMSLPVRSPRVMYESGLLVGAVTEALQDFTHAGYEGFQPQWQLDSSGNKLLPYTHALENESKRDLVQTISKAMQEQVIDNTEGLRKGYLHGDIHEKNIVLTEDNENLALIDFQASYKDFIVWELCLRLGFVLMYLEDLQPLEATGQVLAGYLTRFSLNKAEQRILRIGSAAGMAQNLTFSAWNYKLRPENPRLLKSEEAWIRLCEFWSLSDSEVYEKWNSVILSYGLQPLCQFFK